MMFGISIKENASIGTGAWMRSLLGQSTWYPLIAQILKPTTPEHQLKSWTVILTNPEGRSAQYLRTLGPKYHSGYGFWNRSA